MVKLAIISTNWGIPLPDLLDATRLLINKQCTSCSQITQILRKIHELGPNRAEKLIKEIINDYNGSKNR